VKTIVKKTITFETKRYDFDNEFSYIESWQNSTLKDCYFVEKEFLYPDGSIKNNGTKYFFSKSLHDPEKEIKPLNYISFNHFDHLFFIDANGVIRQIAFK
jgi:hypothetical protein